MHLPKAGILGFSLLFWGGLMEACGGDDEPTPPALVESSADPRQNVLVIDDGFDPVSPAFRGKVAGRYTIVCKTSHAAPRRPAQTTDPADAGASADAATDDAGGGNSDGGGDEGPSFEMRKASYLESLRSGDDSCHLEPGITAKPDPLARIARYRDRWNSTIRGSRYASETFTQAQYMEISTALDQDLAKAHIHGTATAGVVAHENPSVRLVLVEEVLGDADVYREQFTCPNQHEIDVAVALMTDPDIQQAYALQPLSTLDQDLQNVARQHRVGVRNESFGRFSRQALDELQAMKGCMPPVDFHAYFTALGALDAIWARAHPDASTLLVKAAGNDHSQIDSATDQQECAPAAGARLMVGAYQDDGRLAEFTNFGACVDVFAPGRYVITPIPGGWVLPLSGTSFSAPLVVRLVSLDGAAPFEPLGARDGVLARRDLQHRIPIAQFPKSILFDPDATATQWALTREDTHRAASRPPRISERLLRHALRFLR